MRFRRQFVRFVNVADPNVRSRVTPLRWLEGRCTCSAAAGASSSGTTGIKTDAHARALGADGRVVGGLYAAGNDMVSIMGGNYPGAGITLGPALTFGYIAGKHMAAM